MHHSLWRALSRLAVSLVMLAAVVAACSAAAPSTRFPAAGRAAPVPAAKPGAAKSEVAKSGAAKWTPATAATLAASSTTPATSAALVPTATTAASTATTQSPTAPPAVWAGKGMWIWQPEYADGGDGSAIVRRAVAEGITTLYVRTGSSHDGLTVDWAMALLPIAHAAGVRVVGWDFAELDDIDLDVVRAMNAMAATAVNGTHLDGFAADIETQSEGTNLSAQTAFDYGTLLRASLPPVPLIACVPNPTAEYQGFYPYADATSGFDAVAPMVYWLNRDPAADVAQAIDFLARFQKPIAPIGQAFDGGPEGGRGGQPTAYELSSFAQTALEHGASGLSFWSWQHADDDTFANIGSLPEVGVR